MSNELLNIRCDRIMAGSFYAMIFFLPIASAIPEALFVVAFIAFIVKRAGSPGYHFDPLKFQSYWKLFEPIDSAVNKPIGIYVLICALSILVSYNPLLSMKGFVFKLLQGAYLYFMFIEVFNSRQRFLRFLTVLIASAGLIIVDGIFQYLFRADFIRFHLISDGRVTSSLIHSNDLGAYLVSVLPLFFMFLLFGRNSSSLKGTQNPTLQKVFESGLPRLVGGGLFLAGAFTLIVTYSRGSWLAFIVSALLIAVQRPKFLFPILGILTVFAAGAVFGFQHEGQLRLISKIYLFSNSGREDYWLEAIHIIKENPVLGIGLNAYSIAAKDYVISWGGYPHNCYLQVAAETGLLGLGAFLWIIATGLMASWQFARNMEETIYRVILVGLMAGFIGFLTQSFFDTTLYSVNLGILFWILLGMIMAAPVLLGQKHL